MRAEVTQQARVPLQPSRIVHFMVALAPSRPRCAQTMRGSFGSRRGIVSHLSL
jgi:hypothetical protein